MFDNVLDIIIFHLINGNSSLKRLRNVPMASQPTDGEVRTVHGIEVHLALDRRLSNSHAMVPS